MRVLGSADFEDGLILIGCILDMGGVTKNLSCFNAGMPDKTAYDLGKHDLAMEILRLAYDEKQLATILKQGVNHEYPQFSKT